MAPTHAKASSTSSNPFSDSHSAPVTVRAKVKSNASPPKDIPTVKLVEQHPPRQKLARSSTNATPATQAAQPPKIPRSQSQDSTNGIQTSTSSEKERRRQKSKKGSVHADIIDRLDYSAVGSTMFHHDGPFDACAPSRNRHRTKAPMLAWSGSANNEPSSPISLPDTDEPPELLYTLASDSSPVAQVAARTPSDIMGPGGFWEPGLKKRTDTLAEAWGVAEPEPFEEFLAGGGSGRASAASSMRAGRDGHSSLQTSRTPARRGRDGRDGRDAARSQDIEARTTPRANQGLPPPQPISLPGAAQEQYSITNSDDSAPPSPTSHPAKRSRSLMQRIRKMRETPNVPLSSRNDDHDNSPSAATDLQQPTTGAPIRPGHKSTNSFLGRLGRSPPSFGPVTDASTTADALNDADPRQKNLPILPLDTPESKAGGEAYFDESAVNTQSGTDGIARGASLMRKVVRGVKRAGKV